MSKTTIKTIRQFKDGIDAAFETQQARDRISSIEAVRRSFVSRLIAASRGSRPLALLALLGRPLTRANLGRSRRARANLENLDERITAPCGCLRPIGKQASRAKRVPSTFAARSRSASTASGLGQLELPRIAALHSALPPTLANPALGLARIPTLKLKLKAKAVSSVLAAVALAATFSGCYVGKATFQGEDMKMYPFFSTTAATAAPAD